MTAKITVKTSTKPRCTSPTGAHHMIVETPQSTAGGIVAAACILCGWATTYPSTIDEGTVYGRAYRQAKP